MSPLPLHHLSQYLYSLLPSTGHLRHSPVLSPPSLHPPIASPLHHSCRRHHRCWQHQHHRHAKYTPANGCLTWRHLLESCRGWAVQWFSDWTDTSPWWLLPLKNMFCHTFHRLLFVFSQSWEALLLPESRMARTPCIGFLLRVRTRTRASQCMHAYFVNEIS